MTRKRLLASLTAILTIVATSVMLLSIPLYAQQLPLPTGEGTLVATIEHPDGPSITDIPQKVLDAQATNDADLYSRVIFDYRIAYLIAENNDQSDSTFSSANMTHYTGSQTFYSWAEFIEQNTEEPFSVVVVHSSSYDSLDPQWFYEAYRSNVIIIGLNLTYDQMVVLTGDECLDNPNPGYKFKGDFFNHLVYHIHLQDESYREIINQAELHDCNSDYSTGGTRASVSHGTSQIPSLPNHPLTPEYLAYYLIAETKNYAIPNPRIIE